MGARIEARDGPLPAVHRRRRAAARDRVRAAGGERAGQVVRAARRPRDGRDDRDRAGTRARPHRADAAARRAPRSRARATRAAATGPRSATPTSSSSSRSRSRATSSSAAFLIAAGVLVPGSRLVLEGVGVNWTRTGFLRILERMGAIVLGELEPVGAFDARGAGGRPRRHRAPRSRARRSRPHEVPLAIDELPLVALLGCFAEGETVVRGAAELRVKESDRIATRRRRAARARRRHRGGSRRVRRARHRRPARRPARRRTATTASRCSARSPGWPPRKASRSIGMEAAAVSYPGFARGHRGAGGRVMVVAIDGPGRGGQVERRARRRDAARLHVSRLGRDVPLRRARGAASAARAGGEIAAGLRIELGERVLLDGRDVTDAIRTPEVSEAASRVAADPAVREAMVAEQRRLLGAGDWVAEGRDIGTVVAPGRRGQGVPDRRSRRARPAARRRARRRRRHRARRADDPRRARPRAREHSPLRAGARRVVLDTTGLTLDRWWSGSRAMVSANGSHLPAA